VTVLCGGRALSGVRALSEAVAGSVRQLSVLPAELPAAIERLQGDAKELRRQIKGYQEQVAASRAAALVAEAVPAPGGARAVVTVMEGWDANGLKLIASRAVEQPGIVAVLLSAPTPSAIVVARSGDVATDAGAVLRQIVGRFGGKGGGRPELAQGGGIAAAPADVLEFARALVAPPQ
jgi:alanyl-tRNA synthetase